jgi:3-dehydrotetronate 4-kinase
MTLLLGCIADDFTGATDLANNLVRAGMRTVQTIGVPTPGVGIEAQAVVVALKSRTAPVADAVAQALAAACWLRAHGATQIYFKVCSTFDSTPQGNIGPVAQALADELGAGLVIVTPAFPENGRTVFKGHLFVGDVLLSDSPMRQHPLTPMTDANLVRVLQAQLPAAQVGLIDHRVLLGGVPKLRERMTALRDAGVRFAIADAVTDADLRLLAQAAADEVLVVAGSGLAIGIPARHGLAPSAHAALLPAAGGSSAIVSGSCSAATQAQVQDFISRGGAAWALDPLKMAQGQEAVSAALAWALPRLGHQPLLITSTAAAPAVAAVQAQLGVAQAGAQVEQALSQIAAGLVAAGVGRLVVAGGETSGACVQALGITQLRIGPQIDPGVPWCHAELATRGLHLALKSGNFGALDFFTRAFAVLP